ncbi:MAG TPA: hypothetical protein VN929_00475 [Burkholderiales bacterium]|nr:hypothetical protein [Burkholderiales bacterium]
MGARNRIYRRTEAGQQAWENEKSGVSAEHRYILGLVGTDTHFDVVRGHLGRCSSAKIFEWLVELEDVGLLESVPGAPEHDLDFTTGKLDLAVLAAAHNSR